MRAGLTIPVVVACLASVGACGGTQRAESAPEPEFDDLDVALDEPAVTARPQLINAERRATVLKRLPHSDSYRGVFAGGGNVVVESALRETVDGEPGGYASVAIIAGRDRHDVRIEIASYYAAAPPHRLVAGHESWSLDGELVTSRDFTNSDKALWIRATENGVARPPTRRPPSRATLDAALAIFVDPEQLSVGATQKFVVFDSVSQRDRVERVTVRKKGLVLFNGERMQTVLFESGVGGPLGAALVAGGRYMLRLETRHVQIVRAR